MFLFDHALNRQTWKQNLFTDATICSALLGLFYKTHVGKKKMEFTDYTEAVCVTACSSVVSV